ncbi:MAG: alpha/beta hydrolase [Acidobacteriia bacterium]|nr:alpha/beta hydrolase [Terriglobia bacterium]
MLKKLVRVAPLLALFLLPLLHAEDAFFDSDGVRIHYIVEGSGEPVLLIHGYTSSAAGNWAAPGVIKGLVADHYQVIAIDNRGHGQSEKPHDPAMYGPKMIHDSLHLLDHLKIQKAHIVGYSMGGFFTLDLLCDHPERFLTATLGGAGFDAPANVTDLAESLEQGKGFGPLMVALTPPGQQPPPPEQMASINKMLLAINDPLALAAVVRAGLPQVSEAQVKANKVPTLALVGSLDPLKAGVDHLEAMNMPNLKVVVVPGATHMTAFASPVFIQNLKSFLEEHPAKARAATN